MSSSGQFQYKQWSVWYEKFGTGSTPILLIPGAIGTGRTDFYHQLFGENALNMEEYTLIAVELPGWGRSRPPIREYGSKCFDLDAECCVQLMQSIGYNKFSVIGWSDGARVALVMAVAYPRHINAAILCAVISYASTIGTRNIVATKSIDNWDQNVLKNYYQVYKSAEEIQELWAKHMTFIANLGTLYPNGITNNKFDTCMCPVLVLHGEKDPLCEIEQSLHVQKHLRDAQLQRFPNASHNFHQKCPKEFKKIVENFLDSSDEF